MDYSNMTKEELVSEIDNLMKWMKLSTDLAETEHYEHILLEYSEYRGSMAWNAHKEQRPDCGTCRILEAFKSHLKTGVFPR